MPFDIRQLRYAIAAADLRSFQRAAEMLEVKPSTLSRSIVRLEYCLGAKLFTRTPSGVSVTTVGKDFVREARQIACRVEQLIVSTRAAGQGRLGALMIGHNSPISAGNLRATLFGWRDKHPDVALDGIEAPREELIGGVKEGLIDIAIMTGEASYSGLIRASLWSERLLVAMPADHPLAACDVLSWSDLRDETFLLTASDPGPELRDMVLGQLSDFGIQPKIKMHAISRESLMSMLGDGLGMTITCGAAAGTQYPNVALRELRGPQGPCLVGYSGYWRQDNTNPALRNFLVYLRDRYSLTFELS